MSRASRHNPVYLQPVVRTDIGDEDDPDTPKSKSQRKREVTALQDLGAALEALPKDRLAKVPLPEPLADALREARRITSHEGKRRQMQYIGKLMRALTDDDIEAIRRVLATFVGASKAETARLHAIERWRDRLIADDGAITEFIAAHPDTDVQALRTLVRNARKETQQSKPPKSSRELFQIVKQALAGNDHASDDDAQPDLEDDQA
ncbi:ribosome biogenesis factor YjgA [Ralstonia solanacearum]|uniref:ribosome biogenesis factor YjgA n=1 Tax=Ralstonia solanacearum TaxID=305 RepID=UPI00268F19F3|nr:ribosome biogenesis factor YjgA [Ralstonia solanacearum]